MRLVKTVIFVMLFSVAAPLFALPELLTAWRDKYPESTADDIGGGIDGGCQLCHQSSGGGNGWNSYGWDVRSVYRSNGFDINSALELVENTDQDNDKSGNKICYFVHQLSSLASRPQPVLNCGPNH